MKITEKFRNSVAGTTAVTFALLLIPVALSAGAMVDISRISSASSQVQEATDAAALAAATFGGTNAQKIAEGENYFQANIYQDLASFSPTVTININAQGVVTANSTGMYPTAFMAVGGYSQHEITAFAQVQMAGIGPSEIVFVLDYSNSMADQYDAMRDAVIGLINTLTNNQTNPDVKIGLVPFAGEVYASMDGAYVHSGTPGVTWSNCTIDRKWPWVITDDTPTGVDRSKWGLLDDDNYSDVTDADYYDDCSDYLSNNLVVRPLTINHNATVAQLNAMTPHAGTNVSLGLEFGWQVLSPNAPWTEAVSYADPDWNKYIILLTDGQNNREGFGPGSIFSENQGLANMASVCTAAKNNGVSIITVAYEFEDDEGKAELQACASSAQYYLEGDEQNIATVFDNIGSFLSADAYLSK